MDFIFLDHHHPSEAAALLAARGCPHPCRFVLLEAAADGALFAVPLGAARRCAVLTSLLDAADLRDDATDATDEGGLCVCQFSVGETTSQRLWDVCTYLCAAARSGPPSTISRPLVAPIHSVVSEWEWNFIRALAAPDLCEVMRAADVLEIDSLVELSCARLASMLQDCRCDDDIGVMFRKPMPTEADLERLVSQLPFLDHRTAPAGAMSATTSPPPNAAGGSRT
jgi:hypothetical protein